MFQASFHEFFFCSYSLKTDLFISQYFLAVLLPQTILSEFILAVAEPVVCCSNVSFHSFYAQKGLKAIIKSLLVSKYAQRKKSGKTL